MTEEPASPEAGPMFGTKRKRFYLVRDRGHKGGGSFAMGRTGPGAKAAMGMLVPSPREAGRGCRAKRGG